MQGEIDKRESGGTAKLVYFIYLGSLVFWILVIVGLIIAYVNRDHNGGWVDEHYRFQIRTFWIGLLYGAISTIAVFFVIGWVLLVLWIVWWIVRCAKGLKAVSRSEPYPNVKTWLW